MLDITKKTMQYRDYMGQYANAFNAIYPENVFISYIDENKYETCYLGIPSQY
jgi:hypothetical protein